MATTGTIIHEPFGNLNGEQIERFTLANDTGMTVSILSYGGIIQSLVVPDRNGKLANVVLGFATLDEYVDKSPYFGAIVGRFANRIANGRFELDGAAYEVPVNNGPNSLHGGIRGFDKRVWSAAIDLDSASPALCLSLESADGDEGYPGNLSVRVRYSLSPDDNTLDLDYSATTDAPTILNLSNHSYFNLSGEDSGDILRHVVMLRANAYLPVDESLIPTGELAPVNGTPFDFTEAHIIGERIDTQGNEQLAFAGGYDHCWVSSVTDDPSAQPAWLARVIDPVLGRMMDVTTDQPGVQFYSGNFLDGSFAGTSGRTYGHRSGFCLETQHFPDSPNHPSFPSTVLRPGEAFYSRTRFSFGVI
ncbi:MAG TPA: aldose epimerase family protein [Thermomicrobiales bacterium]|nr:aldose epimerase family protein [Thermomicrobiales bacterium]